MCVRVRMRAHVLYPVYRVLMRARVHVCVRVRVRAHLLAYVPTSPLAFPRVSVSMPPRATHVPAGLRLGVCVSTFGV